MVKKINILWCENYRKFKFILSINNIDTQPYLPLWCIVYGCFHATVGELNSDRLYSLQSLEYLLFGPLENRFVNSTSQPFSSWLFPKEPFLILFSLLAFLPIGLPHSRPFHPSGMHLEASFSCPAPPSVRGVDTRNPGSNMAELNDPTDHHTHAHTHTHTPLNNCR